MKILIAEDDELSRMLLAAVLKKQGHEVVCTDDGHAAWTMFQKEYFPVVISDWLMPVLDGLSLCRGIRQTQRGNYSYIILLTALGGKTNYLEGMSAGADDFMTKPVDEDQLAARIHVAQRILGLRQQVTELEGLLPICASCKNIRDDRGDWCQLETYIHDRSGAQFSHGICPDCVVKLGFSD